MADPNRDTPNALEDLDGYEGQTSLTRRERRALAEAEASRSAPAPEARDPLGDDGPTKKFQPVRGRPDPEARRRPNAEPERPVARRSAPKPAYEEDEDEDELDRPVRRAPARAAQSARRVYDDEDEYYDDEDDDEDDEIYDDGVTFGKRFLGFLKGLLVAALLLLLAITALRLAEANETINLDGFRDGVGGFAPFVRVIFPKPEPKNKGSVIVDPGVADPAADAGDAGSVDGGDAGNSVG